MSLKVGLVTYLHFPHSIVATASSFCKWSCVQFRPFQNFPIAKHSPIPILNPPFVSDKPLSFAVRATCYLVRSPSLTFGSISLSYVSPRATTSDETSGGASQFVDEKRDSVIILEDSETADNNAYNGMAATEETKEESPVDELVQPFDFAEKLNVKLDTDDAGSILLYGGGAIVALWLASAVVGAIDSIPLIPKLLEVVGLSYTIWFTSRYLLFKKNRDELAAKIEELKEQVLGSENE